MTAIDLNADLGESYGPWVMGADDAMLDIVTSANVACGGHAGDANTMFGVLTLAAEKGVCVGAHPGFNDKEGFGRRRLPLSIPEVERLVASQVGSLMGIAGLTGTSVHYVKAHGALANWASEDAAIAKAVVSSVQRCAPDCAVLAISGTQLDKVARQLGIDTYSEIFADRGYGDDGNLVPRSQPGAMINDPEEACERLLRYFDTGTMPTVSGGTVDLAVDSICIHGDSAHAVAMARQVKQFLLDKGFTLKPFVETT